MLVNYYTFIKIIILPLFIYLFFMNFIDFNHSEIAKVKEDLLIKEQKEKIAKINLAYKERMTFEKACDILFSFEEKECLIKCRNKDKLEKMEFIKLFKTTSCEESTNNLLNKKVRKLKEGYICICNIEENVIY